MHIDMTIWGHQDYRSPPNNQRCQEIGNIMDGNGEVLYNILAS